jgi:hypothetical protein
MRLTAVVALYEGIVAPARPAGLKLLQDEWLLSEREGKGARAQRAGGTISWIGVIHDKICKRVGSYRRPKHTDTALERESRLRGVLT